MTSRQLFIGGLPRSGTTVLCETLNSHPKIALGMERYKYAVSNGNFFQTSEDLFCKERFFTYRESDSNIRIEHGDYSDMYRALKEKYDQVAYTGDKVPRFYRFVDRITEKFPNCRIVLIWRRLEHVAMSWERRSRDWTHWPSENGAAAALAYSQDALTQMIDVKKRYGDRLRVVKYDNFFSRGDTSPNRIMNWLELETSSEFTEAVKIARLEAVKLEKDREPISNEVYTTLSKNSRLAELSEQMDDLSR